MPAKRVVYLFGAGATIAEASYAGIEEPLSLEHISELVIKEAKKRRLPKDILAEIQPDDIQDIELYISLLESMQTIKYSDMTKKLRSIFCETIQKNLTIGKEPIKPVLEMALLQMHQSVAKEEEIKGAISVNYDSLLDYSFNEIYDGVNYGIKCVCSSGDYHIRNDTVPLIKLHGSFNWRRSYPLIEIDEQQAKSGKQTEMLWIPPSIQKTRDMYPFNILWGKAFELLDCDILRIVGCRLSQNDWGLISLIFSTQMRTDGAYSIELINSNESGSDIRKRNGFLKNVKVLEEMEGFIDIAKYGSMNPFLSWLQRKISLFRENNLCTGDENLEYVNEIMGVKVR
jgi:hypothetical protein